MNKESSYGSSLRMDPRFGKEIEIMSRIKMQTKLSQLKESQDLISHLIAQKVTPYSFRRPHLSLIDRLPLNKKMKTVERDNEAYFSP